MDTFATDNQARLNDLNNGGRLELPSDSPLGQIYEITNLAVLEIGRHAVANPIEAVAVLSVAATSVDTGTVSGLNADEALRKAYEAHDHQFTVAA